MTVWVVRAGDTGAYEQLAVNEGLACIRFSLREDITNFNSRDALRDKLVHEYYTDSTGPAISSAAGQLWNFVNEVQVGDTIVLPRKTPRVVAVGRVTGAYEYRADLDAPHTRRVEWRAVDVPRNAFDQDLLYSLGGLATVFQVRASDAKSRIEQIVTLHLAGSLSAGLTPTSAGDEEFQLDLEEQISDRILDRIRQRFSGTKLEYLVASILRASGYNALETRQGPDGGIDVVAGQGDLGFGQPRLCVQVKSGHSAIELAEYNRLQGNIRTYGADHGLLVSLGDFTRTVRNENERSFFEIRLWGPMDLVDKLLETYDALPADIQNDIPLRNRRVLIESTE